MTKSPFYSDCVGWWPERLDVLLWLQEEEEEITLDDIRNQVDPDDFDELRKNLGYALSKEDGMRLEDDYHVSYHKEPTTGICYMKHSAIEYVFATEDEIEALHERLLDEGYGLDEEDMSP
jgi:hypothetical protein